MKAYYAASGSFPRAYRIILGNKNVWLDEVSMRWVVSRLPLTGLEPLKPISAKQLPSAALRPFALQELIRNIFIMKGWLDE